MATTFKMKKEPVTGKARQLEISNINVNVGYQETLLNDDGTIIMRGEQKNFNLGNMAPPMGGQGMDDESAKKQAIVDQIEKLVADYLNS